MTMTLRALRTLAPQLMAGRYRRWAGVGSRRGGEFRVGVVVDAALRRLTNG